MNITFGTRVFDILLLAVQRHPQQRHLNAKRGDAWMSFSTQDFLHLSQNLAKGLIQHGLQPGDRVALCANGCPEWNIVDYAIQMAGLVSVPMYVNLTTQEYGHILAASGAKLAFVADDDLFQKMTDAARERSMPLEVFTLLQTPNVPYWESLMTATAGVPGLDLALKQRMDGVTGDSLCTIIFTSGTTGSPNGVMLSHRNMVSNAEDGVLNIPVKTGDKFLSFLPLSHAFERTVLNMLIGYGVEIWYAESIERVGQNLKEVQPHLFTTVPRMLEKVYDRIMQRGYALKGIKRLLFFWAVNLGLQYKPGQARSAWYNFQLGLARKLIFSKWLEALGGNVHTIVVGGAALQQRLGSVFWAAGISIMEGYGLTECSPVVSVNKQQEENNRVGTVGLLLRNVDVKLADDGEILVKSPGVFMGYFQNPELTANSFTEDGWYKTGDIGEWQEGRFLKITDRKKDMFKTSGGKAIAPAALENLLKQSMVIEQAMVIGDGRHFPAALITPCWERLRDWAAIHGLVWTTDLDMLRHPEIVRKFEHEIQGFNQKLNPYEQLKRFALIPDTWGVETGEMTATMKLRRRIILQRYAQEIEDIYAATK